MSVRMKEENYLKGLAHLLGARDCCQHCGVGGDNRNSVHGPCFQGSWQPWKAWPLGEVQDSPQRRLKRIQVKKREVTTGELEKVTWRPLSCMLDLDGEEEAHSARGKRGSLGKLFFQSGFCAPLITC